VTGERFESQIYTAQNDDDDIGAMFNKALIEYTHMLYNKYEKYPKPMVISDEEQAAFDCVTHCHICEQKLNHSKDCDDDAKYATIKKNGLNAVRDHCHLTGQFRGPAHSCCNLQCQAPDLYPVIIHNLSGFDAHLFIKELRGNIRCIPATDEKYISFTREVAVDRYTI
jgi:hypothetical protein